MKIYQIYALDEGGSVVGGTSKTAESKEDAMRLVSKLLAEEYPRIVIEIGEKEIDGFSSGMPDINSGY